MAARLDEALIDGPRAIVKDKSGKWRGLELRQRVQQRRKDRQNAVLIARARREAAERERSALKVASLALSEQREQAVDRCHKNFHVEEIMRHLDVKRDRESSLAVQAGQRALDASHTLLHRLRVDLGAKKDENVLDRHRAKTRTAKERVAVDLQLEPCVGTRKCRRCAKHIAFRFYAEHLMRCTSAQVEAARDDFDDDGPPNTTQLPPLPSASPASSSRASTAPGASQAGTPAGGIGGRALSAQGTPAGSVGGRSLSGTPELNVRALINEENNNNNNKAGGDKRPAMVTLERCPACGKKFNQEILGAHLEMCVDKQVPRSIGEMGEEDEGGKKVNALTQLDKLPPQAPKNLHVRRTTASTIELGWDPPIFTGGVEVLDYEISYSIVRLHRIGRKQFRDLDKQPVLRTTRWMLSSPVAHTGFTITGLFADTAYGDIFVRAVSVNGISPMSNTVDDAPTASPERPGRPTFIKAGKPTMHSVEFSWIAPQDVGGCRDGIVEYELRYASVDTSDLSRVTYSGKPSMQERVARTGSANTSFRLTGLAGGSSLFDITVRAVNAAGLVSDNCPQSIRCINTKSPGRYHLLSELLDTLSEDMEEEWADTSIYTGFFQRFPRGDLIDWLEEELELMRAEGRDVEDASDSDEDGNEEDDDPDFVYEDIIAVNARSQVLNNARAAGGLPGASPSPKSRRNNGGMLSVLADKVGSKEMAKQAAHFVRRSQFKLRIEQLEEDIQHCNRKLEWGAKRRSALRSIITNTERRRQGMEMELDRAIEFEGEKMDSHIVHGRLQRFTTDGLCDALEDELEKAYTVIADSKAELVILEKKMTAELERLHNKQHQLHSRRNALKVFELQRKWHHREEHGEPDRDYIVDGFDRWRDWIRCRHRARDLARSLFEKLAYTKVGSLFHLWRTNVADLAIDTSLPERVGAGTMMLARSARLRASMEDEALRALEGLVKAQEALDSTRISGAQKAQMEQSAFFAGARSSRRGEEGVQEEDEDDDEEEEEEQEDILGPDDTAVASGEAPGVSRRLWRIGTARERSGDLYGAMDLYTRQLTLTQTEGDPQHQVEVMIQIASVQSKLKMEQTALVNYARAAALAKSNRYKLGVAEATMGMGESHYLSKQYSRSLVLFLRALHVWENLLHLPGQARACRRLSELYDLLSQHENARNYTKRAEEIENEVELKCSTGMERLDGCARRLLGVSAGRSETIELERVSYLVPRLRWMRLDRLRDIEEARLDIESLQELHAQKEERMERAERELKRAELSQAEELDSNALTGTLARYLVDDFKTKLTSELAKMREGSSKTQLGIKHLEARCSELRSQVDSIAQELTMETGPLLRQIHQRRKYRLFRFNATNLHTNDVLGVASMGFNVGMACVDNVVTSHDLVTGVSMDQMLGNTVDKLSGCRSHKKPITCVYFVSHRLYTGSSDRTVDVWEVSDYYSSSLLATLRGHTGTVWAVCADREKIVTGSADLSIKVWDAENFQLCTTIDRAHAKTITCLQVSPLEILSGGADTDIKLWQFTERTEENPFKKAAIERSFLGRPPNRPLRAHLIGHETTVSVIRYSGQEIVSGDIAGTIVVWRNSDENGTVLHCLRGRHKGAVTCLQFDAVKIVSAGTDKAIHVTDWGSGDVVQTLKGHNEAILDLQFDVYQIISVATDGELKLWPWGSGEQSGSDDKIHVVAPGESLRKLAIMYRQRVQDLVEWNHLEEQKYLYGGQRVIVLRGTSTETKREEADVVLGKLSLEKSNYTRPRNHRTATYDVTDAHLMPEKREVIQDTLAEQAKAAVVSVAKGVGAGARKLLRGGGPADLDD